MKSLRWFGLLLILGMSAVAANAQTGIAPGDPVLAIDDPDCDGLPFCVDLTYQGTTGDQLLAFLVPAPPGYLPVPPSYTCTTNIPNATVMTLTTGQPAYEFNGCNFYGYLTQNDVYTVSSDAPITLTIPADNMGNPLFTCTDDSAQCPGGDEINLSPEPGTALLYFTGLVFLVGFVKRRLTSNLLTWQQ